MMSSFAITAPPTFHLDDVAILFLDYDVIVSNSVTSTIQCMMLSTLFHRKNEAQMVLTILQQQEIGDGCMTLCEAVWML